MIKKSRFAYAQNLPSVPMSISTKFGDDRTSFRCIDCVTNRRTDGQRNYIIDGPPKDKKKKNDRNETSHMIRSLTNCIFNLTEVPLNFYLIISYIWRASALPPFWTKKKEQKYNY